MALTKLSVTFLVLLLGMVQQGQSVNCAKDYGTTAAEITQCCDDITTNGDNENIYYCTLFTESTYYDFWEAFLTGAKLSQFYEYQDKCSNATNYIFDAFNNYYTNTTLYDTECPDQTLCDIQKAENDLFFWSKSITDEWNDEIYYCYLFFNDVVDVTKENLNAFEDQEDLWTSFILNMLSISLSVYNIIQSMTEATDTEGDKDWVQFTEDTTKLIRLLLDFQSATAQGLTEDFLSEYYELVEKDEFQFVNMIVDVPKTHEAVVSKVGAVASTMAGATYAVQQYHNDFMEKNNLRSINLNQGPEEFEYYLQSSYQSSQFNENIHLREHNPTWQFIDYYNCFWGFVDGGLSALPQTSDTYKCNQNFTDFRDHLTDAITHWSSGDANQITDGFEEFHKSFDPINSMFVYCTYAISEIQSADSFFDVTSIESFALNIIYNIGFMVVDVFAFIENNWHTKGDEWPYYAGKCVGDFLMRFFARDDGSLDIQSY